MIEGDGLDGRSPDRLTPTLGLAAGGTTADNLQTTTTTHPLPSFQHRPRPTTKQQTNQPNQAETGALPRPGNAADAAKLVELATDIAGRAPQEWRPEITDAAKAVLTKLASGEGVRDEGGGCGGEDVGEDEGRGERMRGETGGSEGGGGKGRCCASSRGWGGRRRVLTNPPQPPERHQQSNPPPIPSTTKKGATGELSPMAALFGGFVGQEAVKAASGKFTPLRQWFHFDAAEALPDGPLPEAEFEPTGGR